MADQVQGQGEDGQEIPQHKDDHPIFTADPAEFMQYVHKQVCVTTQDGANHSGCVYTIDPVSRSIVLVTFSDDQVSRLHVVMGHMVRDIIITDENTEKYKAKLDSLFRPDLSAAQLSPEELLMRRDRLKSWLLKNRIPVQECTDNPDVLSMSDVLYVQPPYGPGDCQSTNEIVLGKIQGLIKNMPKDVQDW